jgi:hypothetical protein
MKQAFIALSILILAGCASDKVYCNKGPLWCYKTLSGADCYAHRVEGWVNRLVHRYTETTYSAPVDCTEVKETEEKDEPPTTANSALDSASKVAKVGGVVLFLISLGLIF